MYKGKHFSKEEIDFLINNSNIIGTIKCAELLNKSVSSITNKLSRLNIHACKYPKTGINVNKISFKDHWKDLNLDFKTQEYPKELAYFLGYFWADGYINKYESLVLEITEEDCISLKSIFSRLATFSIYKRNRENRKPQASFYIVSKNNALKLKELGKYSNSIESHEKILNFIPIKYHKYFIRGLIDGDGCYYINKEDNLCQLSISNSLDFDWSYLIDYFNKLGINFQYKKSICKSGNSSQIRCTNRRNIKKLIDWLYSDNDLIWLQRKYDKAVDIIKWAKEWKKVE